MKENKLCKVEIAVETILARNPKARNSDKVLIIEFLKDKFGTADLDKIDNTQLPVFESITRARRKLQAEGKYIATDEVIEEREDNQMAFSFVFGK